MKHVQEYSGSSLKNIINELSKNKFDKKLIINK